jgi:hypothetical protein
MHSQQRDRYSLNFGGALKCGFEYLLKQMKALSLDLENREASYLVQQLTSRVAAQAAQQLALYASKFYTFPCKNRVSVRELN